MTQPVGVNFDETVRDTVMGVMADPLAFPEVFKSWVTGWVEANPPTLPAGQITGISQSTVRNFANSTTTVDVTNSVTKTAVLSETVGASRLGTTGALRITLGGDILYNHLNTDTLTLTVAFGGTTIWQDSWSSTNLTAARRAWAMQFLISNVSAQSQFMFGTLGISAGTAAPVTGVGSLAAAGSLYPFASAGTSSVDTTVAQAVTVSAQWSVASASDSFRMQHYMVELIVS